MALPRLTTSPSSGTPQLTGFLGKWNPDGWQALSVIDIYLAALSAFAAFTCAITLRRARRTLTGATAGAALVGVGLIVYRLVEPVVPFDEPIYGPGGQP